MKKKIFFTVFILALVVSCQTPHKQFVEAVYESNKIILPDHKRYIEKDAGIGEESKKRRILSIDLYDKMVKEEYERVNRDGDKKK